MFYSGPLTHLTCNGPHLFGTKGCFWKPKHCLTHFNWVFCFSIHELNSTQFPELTCYHKNDLTPTPKLSPIHSWGTSSFCVLEYDSASVLSCIMDTTIFPFQSDACTSVLFSCENIVGLWHPAGLDQSAVLARTLQDNTGTVEDVTLNP